MQQHLHGGALSGGLQYPSRVIVHLDLDCFYCQVEQKRLSIPREVPCAVQQWQGLIAVNYAARAAGVTRHMRINDARRICPDLRVVHVQTIGSLHPVDASNAEHAARDTDCAAHDPSASTTAAATAAAGDVGDPPEGSADDRDNSKACLQRYRKASAEIMRLLTQMCPGCMLEKASIDEAYLDITPLAVQELAAAEQRNAAVDVAALLSAAAAGSIVMGDGGLQADVDYDRLAAAGAVVALRLRAAVFDQLGYTASAGIACNKLLAKIVSARNKPNKQTVVLPRAVEALMQDLPIGKVKGLGGKLGARLEELGASTTGAVAALPWETLVEHMGTKARWCYNIVRGVDDDAVTPRDKVKSINSCKSFNPTSELSVVRQWLEVLAQELAERMAEDEEEHARRARCLVLQYRGGSGRVPDRSIRGAMPTFKQRDSPEPATISAAALSLFKRISPAPWPLVRLALVATEFMDLGAAGAGSEAAMARFLAGTHSRQQQQQQQREPKVQQLDAVVQDSEQQQQVQQIDCAELVEGKALRQSQLLTRQPHQLQQPRWQQGGTEQTDRHHQQQQPFDVNQVAAEQYDPNTSTITGDLAAAQQGALLQQNTCAQTQQPDGAHRATPLQPQSHQLVANHQPQVVQHQSTTAAHSRHQVSMTTAAPNDELLLGVDVAEQARLLREIEVQQLRQRTGQHQGVDGNRKRKQAAGGAGSRRGQKGAKSDKQQNIADMFGKLSK